MIETGMTQLQEILLFPLIIKFLILGLLVIESQGKGAYGKPQGKTGKRAPRPRPPSRDPDFPIG